MCCAQEKCCLRHQGAFPLFSKDSFERDRKRTRSSFTLFLAPGIESLASSNLATVVTVFVMSELMFGTFCTPGVPSASGWCVAGCLRVLPVSQKTTIFCLGKLAWSTCMSELPVTAIRSGGEDIIETNLV